MVAAVRRHTLLPLDNCLYTLQPTIPHLTRSALHRCLQRHGISRLPDVEGEKPKRQRFKRYPIGFFHIDIAEVQTGEGKLYLFVAIDRTSKFAVTLLVDKADRRTAWEFLERLLRAVPYRIHTILTDNGIQFAEQPRNRNTAWSRPMRFDMICEANGIEHRLTKPNHPWTNGQVERMNRTIKDATVKRFHSESHDRLRAHLADVMAAYNFGRRLKTLGGLTPYEYIARIWTAEPDRFIGNPIHQMPGLNISIRASRPIETVSELNAALKEAGERFRAGDVAGSRELAERAWNLIPKPKCDWDFFPEIIIRHMVTLAVADRDEPRLRRWINELYGVYRDPLRQDLFTVSIEADALRDIGLADESAKVRARIDGRGDDQREPAVAAGPELDDAIHARIQDLSAEGDDATDADDFATARRAYGAALALLPEPHDQWSAWTWLQSAIGDTYFFEGRWTDCQARFDHAVAGPDGLGNPFIHLRLGQCAVELGNEDRAKDELPRAYMGAGRDIFDDEPRYLDLLETRVDLRSIR